MKTEIALLIAWAIGVSVQIYLIYAAFHFIAKYW